MCRKYTRQNDHGGLADSCTKTIVHMQCSNAAIVGARSNHAGRNRIHLLPTQVSRTGDEQTRMPPSIHVTCSMNHARIDLMRMQADSTMPQVMPSPGALAVIFCTGLPAVSQSVSPSAHPVDRLHCPTKQLPFPYKYTFFPMPTDRPSDPFHQKIYLP